MRSVEFCPKSRSSFFGGGVGNTTRKGKDLKYEPENFMHSKIQPIQKEQFMQTSKK